ncbi:hypothetical protein HMI54_013201 [Coelomomyces lativittatus]|nr:hypothetical protein HMI56_006792 [Coelomomyces lativittatus]KAJ1514925.1 hypothetical protein HMI54_013201 [Coelomomyces lativittatus]KAJ1515030.1 hypothetical protein HMI55_004107 [Coelomomyces lativittatus]
MEPLTPPSNVSVSEPASLDVSKLASHEHRLSILSELAGTPIPKEHNNGYYLLTDLFALHASLKPRNALKRMRALKIQGKWIWHYSGGRYCTLEAFDRYVLKYIQTDVAKKICGFLNLQSPSLHASEKNGEKDQEWENYMDDIELDELENDLIAYEEDLQAASASSKTEKSSSMKPTRSRKRTSTPSSGNPNSFPQESPSRQSGQAIQKSAKNTNVKVNPTPPTVNSKEKRPAEDPLNQLRQNHKYRALQIQDDMIQEERNCVQFLYNTLRNLHQQIAAEYKEETAKQITVINEQLKVAKSRLKDVLEFEI